MRRLLEHALQRKKADLPQESVGSPPPYVMSGPIHTQRKCLLFQLLSADVRLLIHEAILTTPGRLLHIVSYRGTSKKRGLGHWHCVDELSPYPTWQHRCFGSWEEEDRICHRKEPRSNSNLVSWLLTCRLVYSEGINILYNANAFSLQGASGLLYFRQLLPAHNWDKIRRINLSTTFKLPMNLSPAVQSLPPENYVDWKQACTLLETLSCLQRLSIDITIWNWYDYKTTNTMEPEALLTILGPLQSLKVHKFDVEINSDLPEAVKSSLGPLSFKLIQRSRPYNSRVFRQA